MQSKRRANHDVPEYCADVESGLLTKPLPLPLPLHPMVLTDSTSSVSRSIHIRPDEAERE